MPDGSRIARLRARLAGAKEARLQQVETLLRACGWCRRRGSGGHRVWVKAGRRAVVIPVHGKKVREHYIRGVLEATREEEEGES